MGFLKFLLIAIAVYYGLLLAGRWLMPWLLRYAAKRTVSHMEKKFGNFQSPQSDSEAAAGDISGRSKQTNTAGEKPVVGEYIEFEEIE